MRANSLGAVSQTGNLAPGLALARAERERRQRLVVNQIVRSLVVLFCLFFSLALDWVYINLLSPAYNYMGFLYFEPELGYAIAGHIVALLPSLWIPLRIVRPSQIAYLTLYFTVFIPGCIIPFYTLQSDPIGILEFDMVLLLSFAISGCFYRAPLLTITLRRIRTDIFWYLVGGTVIVSLVAIFATFGVQFRMHATEDVYQARSEFKDNVKSTGVLIVYVINWYCSVWNPMLIIYGMHRKSFIPLAVGCVGEFIVYSVTSFKSVMFSIIAIFIVYFLYKTRYFTLWLVIALTSLIVFCYSVDEIIGEGVFWSGLFTDRFVAMPGVLTGYYYEFFRENKFAFLGHSILKMFIDYPYPLEPPQLIGGAFLNNPSMNANANIWADGYANFGFPGVIVVSIALRCLFWLYDSAAEAWDSRSATMLLVVPTIALTNGGLLTSLLTNGIGLVFLLCLFSPICLKQPAR